MVVSAFVDVELIELQLVQEDFPLLAADVGGRVHESAVADHQAVVAHLGGHIEVSVFQGEHSAQEVFLYEIGCELLRVRTVRTSGRSEFLLLFYLKVHDLLVIQLSEGNSSRHQHRGGLWNSKYLKAKAFLSRLLQQPCKIASFPYFPTQAFKE